MTYLVPETNLVNNFDPSSVANSASSPVVCFKLIAEIRNFFNFKINLECLLYLTMPFKLSLNAVAE